MAKAAPPADSNGDGNARRRARRARPKAHAEYAHWSYSIDDQGNAQYTGRFDNEDGDHALGTVRHFIQSHWIADANYQAEREGRLYVVRLESRHGDRLGEFEHWWTQGRGNNLPAPRNQELRHIESRQMWQELADADRNTLAFQPGPQGLAQAAIRQVTWQGVEGPGQDDYIAAEMPTREVAFQVALYLRDKKIISEDSFWRLNEEIKHFRQRETPLRIVIAPEHLAQFEEEFPDSGKLRGGVTKDVIDQITTISNRPQATAHR